MAVMPEESKPLEQVLAEHPFFQGIKPDNLEFIIDCAFEQRFDAGDYILRQGDEAKYFYLIRQGQVVLEKSIDGRNYISQQSLGADEILGWSWLISPYQWHFDALVVAPTRAIVLDGERIRDECEADADFAHELLTRLRYNVDQRLKMTKRNYSA